MIAGIKSIFLFALSFLLAAAALAAEEGRAVLMLKERLPDLPGFFSSYQLNRLPATAKGFVVARELTDHSLPGGHDALNFWASRWNAEPLGKEIAETAIVGTGDWEAHPSGTASALILSCPGPKNTIIDKLFILRDFKQVAAFNLPARKMWVACISPDGQVVCRRDDTPSIAYFYAPGKAPYTKTYTGTFLNWDFGRGWAMYATDRTIVVVSDMNRQILKATMPFVVKKAAALDYGAIMVGSQNIGRDGPSWRVLLDQYGKKQGETVFGEWRSLPDNLPAADDTTGKRLPSPYLASYSDGKVEIRYKNSLALGDIQLASNTLYPYTCFDAMNNIASLMNVQVKGEEEAVPHIEQSVLWARLFPVNNETPRTLITSADVAKELGMKSAIIYSMTLSSDGNWLGLTVTPNDTRNYTEWWLLQYSLEKLHNPKDSE